MNIMVFGGDGFCGWPTALHLSNKGHNVHIVDNLSRRKIDFDLGAKSLTPISSIFDRTDCWHEITGKCIGFTNLDVANEFSEVLSLISDFAPDAVVHFAEQRAAPYSMKTVKTKNYTINNNIVGTHNILNAVCVAKPDCHIVHLGTMGVYGYGTAGLEIPEGYLEINVAASTDNAATGLYPTNPGSIYHFDKVYGSTRFRFLCEERWSAIT